MKDWLGNSKSIYTTLGASNHVDEERAENDFYATDSKAIDVLLEKTTLSHNLWECACGTGNLSKRLAEYGYNVKSTDLIYRGYGEGGWTSYKAKRNFVVTLLRTHLISMLKNLLNTHYHLFRTETRYICF